ncbi:MAG TPA: MAPEG family protein [Kofleriaceae bacterium]|jgi:hypothetical protein
MVPVITALYGALNAMFNVFLANNVSTMRRKHNVSIGTHPAIETAIRAHGNNAEFVPMALIVLLLLELCGANHIVLHVMGGALFVGRLLHWIGLPLKAPNAPRFIGVAITYSAIGLGAAYLLYVRFKLTGAF